VRTVPLRELVETYKKERRRPVSKTDADNIDRAFEFFYEVVAVNATTADFGGAESIEKLQNFLIKKINKKGRPYCRKYINKLIAFIRSVFYWGAKKKFVSYTIAAELKLVSALQYGEALHENLDREAASPEAIIATIRHLAESQLIDMVILQVLTGMRPSELCNLKAGEIKRKPGENVWTFEPFHHKTKWKGKPRSIALGVEEMAILEKYLAGKKPTSPVSAICTVTETGRFRPPRTALNSKKHRKNTVWNDLRRTKSGIRMGRGSARF